MLYTNAAVPLPFVATPLPSIDKLLLEPTVGVTLPTDDALHVPIGAWPPPPGTTVLLAQKLMAPVDSLTDIMPHWVCCVTKTGTVEVEPCAATDGARYILTATIAATAILPALT